MGIGEVGELLRRSTVHIRSGTRRGQSAGSGVIWNSDGTVITNAHVVGTGTHSAELWDGRTVPAALVERDDHRDLAKLKLPVTGLAAVRSRETAIQPGELVVAVGNPLGFTGALTTGVVNTTAALPGLGRRRWVQAAIRLAPGNSGGPLADTSGRLVGINTMVVAGGIALAIPTPTVLEFSKNGAGPRLGITIQPVVLAERRLGLLVLSVDAGSAAERASLMIGDILIGANGNRLAAPEDLSDSLGAAGNGIVELQFLRGDHTRERRVAIALYDRSRREAA